MASLARITNNFFVNLINRLGVRPPFSEGFELLNTVVPVSIVDSDIFIPATVTPPLRDVDFSAGVLAAPALNTVLADTGALAAGDYNVLVLMSAEAVATTSMTLQRRDAANAANLWSQMYAMHQSGIAEFDQKIRLETNERLRVIVSPTAGGGNQQATIFVTAA